MSNLIQQRNFEQLAGARKYYQWMTETMRPWIGNRILEVGCGDGNITANFLDKELVVGIDTEEDYLARIRTRFQNNPNFVAEARDITNESDVKELKRQKFDTIISLNVIEHIRDDGEAAKRMYEILEPKGSIIMLAPAFETLMTPYDLAVGHYRRYRKASLSRVLKDAGFRVQKTYYFNMAGALAWFLKFKMMKRTEVGAGSVGLLETLVPFLKMTESIIPAPFGLSVIAIGTKL